MIRNIGKIQVLGWLVAALVLVLAACAQPGAMATLTVDAVGNGTVVSTPEGIDVVSGGDDTADFAVGTEVTLNATAAAGWTFDGWSGACSGAVGTTCTLTMDEAQSATATFVETPTGTFTLDVTKDGTGTGTVTSSPAGIDCGSDCTEAFVDGTVVTLTAAAGGSSAFDGWGGACSSATGNTCDVTMDAAKTASATFTATGTTTTETYAIATNSDDAEEFQTNVNASFPAGSVQTLSSDIDMTYDTANNTSVIAGLRYANVTIPAGSTITSATLTFNRHEAGAGSLTFTIVGQDADNPDTFVYNSSAPATFGISSRTPTTASTEWLSDTDWGATATTPDLSAIVQEIVDRTGWASGNALVFIISSNGDASNYRVAESFDSNPALAAELTVSYIAP